MSAHSPLLPPPPPSLPMQRGYSNGPAYPQHPSHWRTEQNNPYHQYDAMMAQRERDSSFAKRRKTTSHPQLTLQSSSHDRMNGTISSRLPPTPMSATPSLDSDSWQWSYFPDQRSDSHRASIKTPSEITGATARASKPSSRHQRKRSAGCLNCHTIWSPTWRKDSQGLMRCNACGLYLAARGQERPVTLMPKNKTSDEALGNDRKKSTSPRETMRFYTGNRMGEDGYPFPPFYPPSSSEHGSSYMRPSPSFSLRTLGTSPASSSCQSLYTSDLLSPINSTSYANSPLSSPLPFSSMSLESSRRLPQPIENTLGLKGLGRDSSAEYASRSAAASEAGDRLKQSNTLPSPTLLRANLLASRSPKQEDGNNGNDNNNHNDNNKNNNNNNKSTGLMLPPLSDLTRSLNGWRPDSHTSSRHYSISQDRKQTELLDVTLVRSERLMSF